MGLANRLLADRRNPRADVWFPSEPVQTMRLLAEGDVLAPYISPERDGRPDAWRGDADGHYTMLALRLRVLVRRPDGPAWPDGVPFDLRHLPDALRVLREQGAVAANAPVFAMADARFGTTLTHTAAMVHAWGEEATRAWLTGLREAGTAIVAGNMPVVQAVADGSMPWGITDTDDVFAAQAEQREVELLAVPGTLAIPCTVALVEGARNREAAQRFIDWLLSSAGEAAMARTQARFLPTRPDVEPPAGFPTVAELSPLAVDWAAIDDDRATAVRLIQEIWPAE